MQAFCVRRAALAGAKGAKTGAITAVQRASSDMRLNPHLHTIALDGTWSEQGNELVFTGLGHLKTREVGDVLEHAVRRIERHLGRCGLLETREDNLDLSGEGDPESNLASSAVAQARLRALRPIAARRAAVVDSPSTAQAARTRLRQAALRIA